MAYMKCSGGESVNLTKYTASNSVYKNGDLLIGQQTSISLTNPSGYSGKTPTYIFYMNTRKNSAYRTFIVWEPNKTRGYRIGEVSGTTTNTGLTGYRGTDTSNQIVSVSVSGSTTTVVVYQASGSTEYVYTIIAFYG